MAKIIIYMVPGLAANKDIFEHLELPLNKYELYYLPWLKPLSEDESITNYAMRMADCVKHKNVVLLGVSFGGIMAQEMSKFLVTKKVIIISSIKTNNELPKKLKLIKATKLYKLFPAKLVANFEDYAKIFLGTSFDKKAKNYKKYLSVRDKTYLNWSVKTVLNFNQKKALKNIIHIHGTKDAVFPIKNISNYIAVKEGTHIMILTKAKQISKIIDKTLTC